VKSLPHMGKVPETSEDWLVALVNLARYLRGPQGCPWDREQTVKSFARYLRQEAEELNKALEEDDSGHIAEELGDTFFCALMTAVVAEDEGRFTLKEALERVHEKMVRRHAHIFGDRVAKTPGDVVKLWRHIKKDEG